MVRPVMKEIIDKSNRHAGPILSVTLGKSVLPASMIKGKKGR